MPRRLPPNVTDLALTRALREEPHVVITIEAWWLGNLRWYYQPETRSRVGEPLAPGWSALSDMLITYGHELRAHGCPRPPKRKRVKSRKRRR